MRPLEIATLVSRVKVASDTEAYCGNKDVGSVRRQSVGLTLETSALGNRFEKMQPSARTSDTQTVQFGANAVRNVCRIK